MESLEDVLGRVKALDTGEIAEAIQAIGFECTRCGRCCSGTIEEPHTATVFPDEIRAIQQREGLEWDEVARPMPYGLSSGEGETFEWALQTDTGGDCRFLEATEDGTQCTVYEDRPLICQTYPFSVPLAATEGYEEAVVAESGPVQAHECPGLEAGINRDRAMELAATLRERAVREIEEAIAVREAYDPDLEASVDTVVYDSEGPKRPTGRPLGDADIDSEDFNGEDLE